MRIERSLRMTLALWMLPLVAVLFLSSVWLTQVTTAQLADSAYDRSLNGALSAIAANVSTQGGGVGVELPYPLFQSLQATAAGTVYFRVSTSDGLVEIGDSGLPTPPAIATGETQFYNAAYLGQALRVGALRAALAPGRAETVLIEVAETTASRQAFLAQVGRAALWRDMATTVAGVAALFLGLSAAIKPLSRLRERFANRRVTDLAPIDDSSLPAELRPLVQMFNTMLARQKDVARTQREFLDGAAHQLRTPLSILAMQLDYARTTVDPAEREAALAAMRPVIDRASHTATQMLALARADTFTAMSRESAAPVDLGRIAEDVARMHLPAARRRRIGLEIDRPEAALMIRGDETLLHEAISNLVDNALRFSPDKGRVLLSLAAGRDIRVSVLDSGPGMAPARLAAVGARFMPGGDRAQNGLGLSIALTVAQAHGGRLEARNRPEGGLDVTILLPAA